MTMQTNFKPKTIILAVLTGIFIFNAGPSILNAQDPLQEVRDLMFDNKYKEAIQKLNSFIEAKPPAPKAPQAPGDWKPLAEAHYLLAKNYSITVNLADPKVETHLKKCFQMNIDFDIIEVNKFFKKKMDEVRTKVPYMEYTNEKGYLERCFRQGIVMIQIPAGEFKMGYRHGSSDEQPVHTVHLDTYWIGKYEVSMGQYRRFMVHAKHRSLPRGITSMELEDTYPVVGVSWNDAISFCKWMSNQIGTHFTLPTEAQWEKAARGTGKGKRIYPWGDQSPQCKWASYKGCVKRIRTIRSCHRGTSPYGAHHMAGNVYEWCRDWYAMDYYANSAGKNPMGGEKGSSRVFRGGSFKDDKRGLRSAKRNSAPPTGRGDFLGFRLCIEE